MWYECDPIVQAFAAIKINTFDDVGYLFNLLDWLLLKLDITGIYKHFESCTYSRIRKSASVENRNTGAAMKSSRRRKKSIYL